jgi:nitroreductase/NAD-dependent dihydropyrimidine dehydrogenase PreA subunit
VTIAEEKTMLQFTVDRQACTRCGLCVSDCPVRIIALEEGGYPAIAPVRESSCLRCQHCLAVCPTAAVSILGLDPQESTLLAGNYPHPDQLVTLMKGRRSVRAYRPENLEPALVQRLLATAWHAPTGHNARNVRFTVVDDRGVMAGLRSEVMAGLGRLAEEGKLPEEMAFFAGFVRLWEEKGRDVIFRDAPHLLLASAPRGAGTPREDCLISLSYFELLAQDLGVGTVWNGFARWAVADLLPEVRQRLGIPDDHLLGGAISFGPAAIGYSRTVQYRHPIIHRVD